MASLLDSARMRGYRNRWKTVVSHVSVNELSGSGSFEYDNYALMLINFVISGLETVEQRTDERRLLNSLKFTEAIEKLRRSIDDMMMKVAASGSSDDTASSPVEGSGTGAVPISAASGINIQCIQITLNQITCTTKTHI